MAPATGMDVADQCSGAGMSLANLISLWSSFGLGTLSAEKGWLMNALNQVNFITWIQYLTHFIMMAQYMPYHWSSNLSTTTLEESRAGQTFPITPSLTMFLDHFDLRNSILSAI